MKNRDCNDALIRIYEKINLDDIFILIDSIEELSDVRKEYLKKILFERYDKILKPAYLKLSER